MKSRNKIRLIKYQIAGLIILIDAVIIFVTTHFDETKQFVENLFG